MRARGETGAGHVKPHCVRETANKVKVGTDLIACRGVLVASEMGLLLIFYLNEFLSNAYQKNVIGYTYVGRLFINKNWEQVIIIVIYVTRTY